MFLEAVKKILTMYLCKLLPNMTITFRITEQCHNEPSRFMSILLYNKKRDYLIEEDFETLIQVHIEAKITQYNFVMHAIVLAVWVCTHTVCVGCVCCVPVV